MSDGGMVAAGRRKRGKSIESIVVSTDKRELRESEPDQDFDPEVISQMSPDLRRQIKTGMFSHAEDGTPVERFVPVKPPRCRRFWRRVCCRGPEDPDEEEEEGVDEESLSTVQRTDTAIYPYDPQPTLESTNLQKKHKGGTRRQVKK